MTDLWLHLLCGASNLRVYLEGLDAEDIRHSLHRVGVFPSTRPRPRNKHNLRAPKMDGVRGYVIDFVEAHTTKMFMKHDTTAGMGSSFVQSLPKEAVVKGDDIVEV